MTEKLDRRLFLKSGSAVLLSGTSLAAMNADARSPDARLEQKAPFETLAAGRQVHGAARIFHGSEASQVAMPLGGIGAGCICLNGHGGMQDFSIRNRPATTALPIEFTSDSDDAAFATLHIKGGLTRLVEGPFPVGKTWAFGMRGVGYRAAGCEGLPRFESSTFRAEYPVGHVDLADPKIPIAVSLTAWSPFIPLDDKHSSMPCAILEYTLKNTANREVEYEFAYHISHWAGGCMADMMNSRNSLIDDRGVFLFNTEPAHAEGFGSAAMYVVGEKPRIKGMWLRSPGFQGDFDAMSALWREVGAGAFTENTGAHTSGDRGKNGASVLLAARLKAGESRTHRILLAWHFPNAYIWADSYGASATAPKTSGKPGCRTVHGDGPPAWRPYYVSHWKDARELALYVAGTYESLRARTFAFQRALFSSTIPASALDAVASNLAIMKSPTVLRQENGELYGWEGCFPEAGCLWGTNTHVWNYAQAFANLFPQLERTLRELELVRSMAPDGRVSYRGAIPDGPAYDTEAAADGQLGGILKVYRDWQICGDRPWLQRMYPLVKRSLEYCIRTLDPDRKGAIFEPHHNTYDIEFWGADGMCTSIYVAALSAMARMSDAVGEHQEASSYDKLAHLGARLMDRELFNGEYFQQKVEYEALRDQSFVNRMKQVTDQNSEHDRLLKREGPKYQYGSGCLSDGVIGAWFAATYGLETPMSQDNVRSTLLSIYRYNFRKDLSDHANTQRPGYAMGHEGGLVLCSWPRGGKPTLPFIYSDEVWTGIEYQVAAHLIGEGLVAEGMEIVTATRARYDGRTRNPFCEYECGNYYARAMASYALLAALSGFHYSAVDRTLRMAPKVPVRPFKTFFSAATAFGMIVLTEKGIQVEVIEGMLAVGRVILGRAADAKASQWEVTITPERPAERDI